MTEGFEVEVVGGENEEFGRQKFSLFCHGFEISACLQAE